MTIRCPGLTIGSTSDRRHKQHSQLVSDQARQIDRNRPLPSPETLLIMGTADEWGVTVPDDDAELLAELRRHGVRPGVRLHLAVSEPGNAVGESPVERPESFGSLSAAPDPAERAREILQAEVPHGR